MRRGHRPYPFGPGLAEYCGRLTKRSSRCFDIIYDDNGPADNAFRLDHRKDARHISPSRITREFNLRGRSANARERLTRDLAAEQNREFPGKEFGLVESAHALPSRRERNGYEHAPGRQNQSEPLE